MCLCVYEGEGTHECVTKTKEGDHMSVFFEEQLSPQVSESLSKKRDMGLGSVLH